jgi:hypothetical protein
MAAYDDPRVKPHVRAAATEIKSRFGISNIGGFATSGHITNSDHYTGLAIDVMTSLQGQAVADWAQANAKRLSVKYIIWNRKIWDVRDNKGWVPYHGTSPHTDHVHISFFAAPGDGSAPVDTFTAAGGQRQVDGCLQILLDIFTPTALILSALMKGK